MGAPGPTDINIVAVSPDHDEPLFDYSIADVEARRIARDRKIGITSDRELSHVALIDDHVVGAAFVSISHDTYSFDVVVDSAFERRGVGSLLLNAVADIPHDVAEAFPEISHKVDVVSPDMERMLKVRGFHVASQGDGRATMTR
jgi:GNAT superfamily N-acetyltransferase